MTRIATHDATGSPLTLLFPPGGYGDGAVEGVPAFAADLNLDQAAADMAKGQEDDLVGSLFYRQLRDPAAIAFRQQVFLDLERGSLFQEVSAFVEQLRRVRAHLVALQKMPDRHHRNGWHLDAVALYCDAVRALAGHLRAAPLESGALQAFRAHLEGYLASAAYSEMEAETRSQKSALAAVRYCVRIHGTRVEVSRYEGEADFSAEVLDTFERFKQGAAKDYRVAYRGWPGMYHVSEQILGLVARLFPEEFGSLDDYCARHQDFYDPSIREFEREVQFYLAYLEYVHPIRAAGLPLCYPEVGERAGVFALATFDLALARKLVKEGKPVVTNDLRLDGAERVIVVTGPNQGGKTTFARTFGQLHHLASIGCPVPGTAAHLARFDRLFTHFGREEDLGTMTGKLEEDLLAVRDILLHATPDSIVVMNEAFSSTALHDAAFLGARALEKMVRLDLLAVYVTFVDELASFGPSIVSMVSTVVPDDPAQRTFKVVRAPADGLAYAMAIAEKHGVTYGRLRERVGP